MNANRDTLALAAHAQVKYGKDAQNKNKQANASSQQGAAMPKTGDSAAVTLALTLFAAGITTLGVRTMRARQARAASKRH